MTPSLADPETIRFWSSEHHQTKVDFVNSEIGDDLVTVRDDLTGQFTLNIILSDGKRFVYGNSASATINMVVDGGLGRDFIATGSGNDSVTDSGNTGGYAITLDGNDQLNLTGNEFVVTTATATIPFWARFQFVFVYRKRQRCHQHDRNPEQHLCR